MVIDATFPGPAWDGLSSLPLACGAGMDYPAGDDPDAEKRAAPGQWFASPDTLARLGIEGSTVEGRDFIALMEGKHPRSGGFLRRAGSTGGRAAGAERFKSDAHLARLAGVAPIPVSSGRTDRHRLDRGGNRQLNRALHIIAITRGRLDPGTRAYLRRKEAEGKTRIEPMRCLKRHLARRFHHLLLQTPAIPVSASTSGPCLT